MKPLICLALTLSITYAGYAGVALPLVESNTTSTAVVETWAHQGGTAIIRTTMTAATSLSCDMYKIDGKLVAPMSRGRSLGSFPTGQGTVTIPIPETVQRGKVLAKLVNSGDGRAFANVFINVLPNDAWESLVTRARADGIAIDPGMKDLVKWTTSLGLPHSTPAPGHKPAYCFSRQQQITGSEPDGKTMVTERNGPDAVPFIEVSRTPESTRISLPTGFFDGFGDSPTAQAVLLQHLNLLP